MNQGQAAQFPNCTVNRDRLVPTLCEGSQPGLRSFCEHLELLRGEQFPRGEGFGLPEVLKRSLERPLMLELHLGAQGSSLRDGGFNQEVLSCCFGV